MLKYTKEEYEECLEKAGEMANSVQFLMNTELGFEEFSNNLNNLKETYNEYRKAIYETSIEAANRENKARKKGEKHEEV